ncbi:MULTISPECIES: hypothetical protein [Comamonas]|jgi:hypothetical protein|uniref:hypothetical protein n=1 Tax=Comamonas TaxID=283 RepID=UPI000621135D|nr:hypothetical protein [Comamonas thiooxydans]KKI12226.1 hypothetical protein XA67_20730 [Comamonas thiooxydans]UBQ44442.1 hypothetical protein LCH15_25570 [Comamonas thiooxydans]
MNMNAPGVIAFANAPKKPKLQLKKAVLEYVEGLALDLGEMLMLEVLEPADRKALQDAQRVCLKLTLQKRLHGVDSFVWEQLQAAMKDDYKKDAWAFEEEALLLTAMGSICAPELDIALLSKRMNRSPYSVALKALELGYLRAPSSD